MSGFLSSMVGATFTVVATGQVLRAKKTITAFGNAQIDTAQSKFGGASALFDGTGDYLTASPRINLTSTDNFTLECWIRVPNITGDKVILSSFLNGGSYNGWSLELNNATVKWWNGSAFYSFNSSIAANTWYHIAIVSTAGSIKMYQEGVEQTTTSSLDGNTNNTTTPFYIGIIDGFSRAMNGHIDEIRVSNSVRYTTTFTPSTTPFVNDANTLLLIHANGTDASTVFEDDNGIGRSANGITANGNAQVDTAQSKFGGASALFDGNGDYLQIKDNPSLYLWNTQPYTIELWCRINALSSGQPNDDPTIIGNMVPASDADYWSFGPDNSGNLTFKYYNGGSVTVKDTGTMSTGVWYHIAAVITSNTIKIYLDGVEKASASISGTPQFSSSVGLNIGWGASWSYNGWVDEVRISNNARYTTTFTPSTTAFVNDANTLLLIHANGTDASTTFTDDNAQLTITPAATSVNEGSSLTFNVSTIDTADQTLYYTATNSGDFATSSGSFSLVNNAGSFSLTPTADTTTEGAETFTASVRIGSTSGDIIATTPSITINDTSVASIVVNSAFTDDSSTKILLHFENNVVDDNSSGRTAVATQSIFDSGAFRTDQKKFGSYSVGSIGIPGGWSTNNPTALNPGTGDFTIEFWFRPCATANSDLITMQSQSNGSVNIVVSADNGFLGFGKQNISWDVQATVGAISVAWHHFAVTRSGTTLRLYLDGTVRDTVTGNTDNYTSSVWAFSMGGISGTYFHMDEFRISSIARYTSDFTVG